MVQAPLCVLACMEVVIGKVWVEEEMKEKMKELACLCAGASVCMQLCISLVVCVCLCVSESVEGTEAERVGDRK